MERFLEGSFWDDTPEERAEFGLSTNTDNPDQMFIEWLQSKFPEGKPIVYQGNQYYGTGGGDVDSSSTVTEGKPVTLENAGNEGSGTSDKSETKEVSTLDKTEMDSESSDKASEAVDNYEWATHLNDDDDTKDKANTKDNDTKEGTSQYPNGMTKDEFDAMYEFALGMSGKGENTANGIWGQFETLPLKITELTRELDKYERSGYERNAKAAREQLENAKEQLSNLESFISNYKDIYSPIKKKTKSEYKKVMEEAGDAVLKVYPDLWAATDQIAPSA